MREGLFQHVLFCGVWAAVWLGCICRLCHLNVIFVPPFPPLFENYFEDIT